jgi:hypothetical protein
LAEVRADAEIASIPIVMLTTSGAPEDILGSCQLHASAYVGPAERPSLQIPFFRAPAACWCARATVETTGTSQVISPAASPRPCSPVRILRQVPFRCQRRDRP